MFAVSAGRKSFDVRAHKMLGQLGLHVLQIAAIQMTYQPMPLWPAVYFIRNMHTKADRIVAVPRTMISISLIRS